MTETDAKKADPTSTVLGRLLYPEARLPGEKSDRRKSDGQAYLDTVLYPVINSPQLIRDFAPRPAGLTTGIMVGRVIRRYDIFPHFGKPEKMMRLPINDINIIGRRRAEASLLGDPITPSKTLLSIPDLFLVDEVRQCPIAHAKRRVFPESCFYMGKLDFAVEDIQWIRNYADYYTLHRSIDWVKIPRKCNHRASTASDASGGLRISSRTDDDALVLAEAEALADTIRDSPGRPAMSSFIEPCGDIDYGREQTAVQIDEAQMILCGESEGVLPRSLLQHDDISAELKGELTPQIDNVRYTFRVERNPGTFTVYWRTTYRITHLSRVAEAAKILKAHGIRCSLPGSHSIMASHLPKQSGDITKSYQWHQWLSSRVYGAPVTAQIPSNMPKPQAITNEPMASEDLRAAVISGDEDDLKRQGDIAVVGYEFDLWGGSEEECDIPDI